jgi:hypothetical protein
MATATETKTTKTAFVTDFLKENPTANPAVVNHAWAKAGNDGTVSPSLVTKLRSDLGLSGNSRTTPRTSVASPTKKPVKATRKSQGKSSFLKELLVDNPQANAAAANKAWNAAGMKGSISNSLVSNVRFKLGLAGNLRRGPKSAVPKKTGGKTEAATVHAKRHPGDREQMLVEVEDKIDGLIFELLGIGGVEKAVDTLRAARRAVIHAQKA